jgi:hypothetical protein
MNTQKEKIIEFMLENWKEEIEGKTEIRDLDLLVDISASIEDAGLVNNVWLAKRSNDLEEWLSVEFFSELIGSVIIITQNTTRFVSGENSNELAGEIADILIGYEEEGKGIEEDVKDMVRAEIEEVNIKIK